MVRQTSCRAVCIENLGQGVVINASYCIAYSQNVQHAHTRGLGACPPRKILKSTEIL